MKTYVLFSPKEPVLIVTRQTIRTEAVLNQLARVGIHKFIAREVPVSYVRNQYGQQFDIIQEALQKGGDLRVLDFNGHRIFRNLPFSELGPPYRREHSLAESEPARKTTRAASQQLRGSASPAVFG